MRNKMKRKHLFAITATLILAACVYALAPAILRLGGARRGRWYGGVRPNVLFVVMDTTRGDHCSVNGYVPPTTPNLEALAGKGVAFRNCWSAAPWTGSSHATMFTGLRPVNHGFMCDTNMSLSELHTTLAEILRDDGYATGCFSANTYIAAQFGLTQGFERYEGTFSIKGITGYLSPVTHGLAADWIGETRKTGKPWFAFINDLEPHNPYQPPQEFESAFSGDASPPELEDGASFRHPDTLAYCLDAVTVSDRQWAVMSRLYDGEVAYLDSEIGKLLARLEAEGALENTIVVVAGDHGENLGDHRLSEHQFSLHRTLLHVPLVIYAPPAFAPGTVVNDVVRLEDVFPTLLELCGAGVPDDIDGKSLLDGLGSRVARADYGVPVFLLDQAAKRFPKYDAARFATSMRSVFDGRYHLIRRSDGREELYDVIADPLEKNDLAAAPPIDVETLRALLDP